MSTQTDRINEARADWNRKDQAAKTKHAEVKTWVDGELAKFQAAEGRIPHPGDALFDQIDQALKDRDELREAAANAHASWQQLVGVAGAGAYSYEDVAGATQRAAMRGLAQRLTDRIVGSEAFQRAQTIAARGGNNETFLGDLGAGGGRYALGPLMTRDEFEAFISGGPMMPRATTITGGGATSGGPFIQNDVQPGFVAYRRKQPVMLSLVGPGQTDSDTVEYVRQTAVSSAAVETAEDSAAAEATIASETVTAAVKDITHYVPATRKAVADAPQLQTIVEQDLLGGVIDRVDTQIASGDAAGENLRGVYNTSGILTQALATDSRPDALHKAITQIAIAAGVLAEPDAVGLHPSDWQDLRLERDANDNYLYGPPAIQGPKSVFGYPVASSTVFTSGTPLVGAFGAFSTAWIREAPQVYIGLNADDFVKRRFSLLAEARLAFAVKRATAFCTVTGF